VALLQAGRANDFAWVFLAGQPAGHVNFGNEAHGRNVSEKGKPRFRALFAMVS